MPARVGADASSRSAPYGSAICGHGFPRCVTLSTSGVRERPATLSLVQKVMGLPSLKRLWALIFAGNCCIGPMKRRTGRGMDGSDKVSALTHSCKHGRITSLHSGLMRHGANSTNWLTGLMQVLHGAAAPSLSLRVCSAGLTAMFEGLRACRRE